jgi:hypothetical protein
MRDSLSTMKLNKLEKEKTETKAHSLAVSSNFDKPNLHGYQGIKVKYIGGMSASTNELM